MKHTVLIIAGEKSGEEHALSFLPELKNRIPDLCLFGVGGDELQSMGVELLYHLREFSGWGISGVILKIPYYLSALDKIEKECLARNCKTAILIDFQDFNMRLAARLKKHGIEVLYYVAPMAWVWRPKRAAVLNKNVHTLFTLLPFEKKWFMDRGMPRVKTVTHPLYYFRQKYYAESKMPPFASSVTRLLLLPGSRHHEVESLLPVMMDSATALRHQRKVELILVQSPNVAENLFAPYLKHFDKIYPSTQITQALAEADCILAASGTVTLTCGLWQVPTIVLYRLGWLNKWFYKLFIKYSGMVSLTNIILGKEVFPELLQDECNQEKIVKILNRWFDDRSEYHKIRAELQTLPELLKGEDFVVADYMKEVITRFNNT